MRHPGPIAALLAPRWASAIPACGRNALLSRAVRPRLPHCRSQSPARFDTPCLFSLEGCGHKLASPPRSWCHSPSDRSARRNRAAPTALERPIGLVRPPTASGTPCRNCLAGNTTLHVLVALFAPLFCGFLPFAQRHFAAQKTKPFLVVPGASPHALSRPRSLRLSERDRKST